MSRIYIEGFEAGGIQYPLWNNFTTGQYDPDSPPAIVTTPAGVNKSKGTKCMRLKTGGGDYAYLNISMIDDDISQIYIKWRYYTTGQWYNHTMMNFYDAALTRIGWLEWRYDDTFRYTGDIPYSGRVPAGDPPLNEWLTMELWLKLSTLNTNTDGEVEFRVNGVTQFANYSARTSDLTYYGRINKIKFSGGSYNNYAYFDDLIFDSTSSFVDATSDPGLLHTSVVGYVPTSDSTTEWTAVPASANNYANISYTGGATEEDDKSIDAEYIVCDTTGAKDIYVLSQDFSPPLGGSAEVKCVQLQSRGRRYGGCPATDSRPFVVLDSNEHAGDISLEPYSNFQLKQKIWEQNPETSANWTVTDLNNMKIGIEST